MGTDLKRIGEKARKEPGLVFTSLYHHIYDVDNLRACYDTLDAGKATGVDGVSKREYGRKLEENLGDLSQRLRRMGYRPGPKRRSYIPKPGSEKGRPLGISNLEDKIVEKAAKRTLEPIYEAVFEDSSHGYRPGRSQHKCLEALGRTPATFEDFEAEVAPRLSLADFSTFQLAHTLAMNADTFTKNYYLYHDQGAAPGTPEARFRIISWDADATWGQKWDGTPLAPDPDRLHGHDRFSPRLFSIPSYWRGYLEAYEAALAGPGAASELLARVDAMAEEIAAAARADLAAWAEARLAAEYAAPDFDAELARLREAVTARVEVMAQAVGEAQDAQ